jgi:peroxiredoxin
VGLELGRTVPDVELRDQHGQQVRLGVDRGVHRGGRPLVVMFYPYAFSRVCTDELRGMRDSLPAFEAAGAQVVAISCDPVFTLRAFADAEGVTFPLLSDFWPHGAVARAFGVFDAERGCAERSSFVVDSAGVLRWQVHNALPDARDLAEQVRVVGGVA